MSNDELAQIARNIIDDLKRLNAIEMKVDTCNSRTEFLNGEMQAQVNRINEQIRDMLADEFNEASLAWKLDRNISRLEYLMETYDKKFAKIDKRIDKIYEKSNLFKGDK